MGRPTNNIIIDKNYQELAREFYTHVIQLGYIAHSCRNRWLRLRDFLHYAETFFTTDITQITTANIVSYYNYLKQQPSKKDGKPLREKTIIDQVQNIRQFYDMLIHTGRAEENPVNNLQLRYPKEESPRTALTQQELQALYHAAYTYQEKAILAMGYGCGLRVSEIIQCNIEDLHLREGHIVIKKGKGNKGRIVPLSKSVARDIASYLYKERLQQVSEEKKAFIIHSKGKRMQKGTYNKILKKLIERTGVESIKEKNISIHNLRHSIATHLIEQGIPVEQVREFLGHSQLESTEVYTHISKIQLQKLVQ
ncbi:MAG: tyrosine-type recombinase/integrase [Bacteroidota bacterium]